MTVAASVLGIAAHPNSIVKQHVAPVPLLGGLAIYLAWFLSALLFAGHNEVLRSQSSLYIAGLVVLFGVLDDVVVLSPSKKILGQLVLSCLAVTCGVRGRFTGLNSADAMVSILWLMLLMNAFNLVDVCDGLLAVIAVACSMSLTAIHPAESTLPILLAGSCLGFLYFNKPQAKIYAGDAGSMSIGFILASMSLKNSLAASAPVDYWIAVLLILYLPLYELNFLIVARTVKKIPFWRGSPDHFALRLQSRKWTKTSVLILSIILSSTFGWLAHEYLRGSFAIKVTIGIIALGISFIFTRTIRERIS